MAEIINTGRAEDVNSSPKKLKALGDESFVGVPLTESIRDEWCDLFQSYSERLSMAYRMKINNRVNQFKQDMPKGKDSKEKLIDDLTLDLKGMGGRVIALALQACDAIEKMTAANPGSELLLKVFGCVAPFYRDNKELSLEVGEEKISVKVDGIEQCEERLEKLKSQPEGVAQEEPVKEEPKKKSKTPIIIIGAICVVAIIAGIALFSNSSDEDTTVSKSNTEQSQGGDAAGLTEEAQSAEILGLTVYGPADWNCDEAEDDVFFYDYVKGENTYNSYLDIWVDDEVDAYGSAEEMFESYLEDPPMPIKEFDQPGCDRAAVSDADPSEGVKNYYFLCNDKVYMINESAPGEEAEEMIKYLDGFVKMIDFEECK